MLTARSSSTFCETTRSITAKFYSILAFVGAVFLTLKRLKRNTLNKKEWRMKKFHRPHTTLIHSQLNSFLHATILMMSSIFCPSFLPLANPECDSHLTITPPSSSSSVECPQEHWAMSNVAYPQTPLDDCILWRLECTWTLLPKLQAFVLIFAQLQFTIKSIVLFLFSHSQRAFAFKITSIALLAL